MDQDGSEWIGVTDRLPVLGQEVRIRLGRGYKLGERTAVWDHRPPGVCPAFFPGPTRCLLPEKV